MAKRKIEPLKINGQTVYVEVSDIEQDKTVRSTGSEDGYEKTSAADDMKAAGDQVHNTLSALAATVRQALENAEPAEWTIEVNLGFKGKAGIPFIAEGEANGAIKVTAKWKRD